MDAEAHARVWAASAEKLKSFAEDAETNSEDRLAMASMCLLARCVATAYRNEAKR